VADSTITSISLNDVRKLIDDKNIGDTAAEAVDQLLGLVLALSPLYAGPAAPVIMTLIEPKNELIAAFKAAVRKFSKSKPSDYLDRAQRMAAANCLLTYVAFFDALQQLWPSVFRELEIMDKEAKNTVARAMESGVKLLFSLEEPSLVDQGVAIPHPAGDDPTVITGRREIYGSLSLRVQDCLNAILGHGGIRIRSGSRAFELLKTDLRDLAESLYQAEYLGMAAEFEQFFVWTMLRDHAELESRVQDLADDERVRFELIGRAMHSLDLGLQELATAIARLPRPALAGGAQGDSQVVAEGLRLAYAESLQRQVIDDQFAVGDRPQLNFPKRIDAFVPQAYRVVRYEDKKLHLEREDQWQECEVRNGIGAFVLRYLESPYSVQTPLLILGHPGSGKSLLTEMLAGHLAYPTYTTIRVKLRDVNPDADFLTQLEEQIRLDTGGRRIDWADFATSLNMAPPVVILDGYDELLQATGQVFASYLEKVRQFQRDQAVQRRPVRVIVTSRVTLIDRAQIPLGTTVVRLEEFDKHRRAAWSDVWNAHNATYFQQTGTRPFVVPDTKKILDLARQPLLLLMLAIYDSDRNELSARPDIDQTLLYDRLLRRFIERELSKGEAGRDFRALPEADRRVAIDWEMNRLGVAAIGMFNRQDVKITRDQLNADLKYFGAEKKDLPDGRRLQQADLVLGSFFFVHESRSRLTEGAGGPAEGPSAFEFLHNTFGEFLAADFILRRALVEARMIGKLSGDPTMADMRRQRLAMLSEDWLGCLVHTPLHTRPVILEMIREWSRHQLGGEQSRADLLATLDAIVAAQLSSVLNDVTIPDPAPDRRALSSYAPLSRRAQVAIYSLNLVLLRTYLGDGSYVLREDQLGAQAGGCGPWDGLISLWRSWFPVDALASLADMMVTKRRDGLVTVKRNWKGYLTLVSSPMWASYAAAMALGDGQLAAMAGLHLSMLDRAHPGTPKPLWDFIRVQLPELKRSTDLLELKKGAPNGDDLGGSVYPLRVGHVGSQEADCADVAARLTHTPRQWANAEVSGPSLADISALSRYEAEAVVESMTRLEPNWLPGLLPGRYEDGTGFLQAFLRVPAAAPVLRAAVREFIPAQCALFARRASPALAGLEFDVHDIDTAAALIILAHRGRAGTLVIRLLDTITHNCERGAWSLLDIPVGTWEGLADLLRSTKWRVPETRKRLVALADDAVKESLRQQDGRRDLSPEIAQFWIQALRIGAIRYLDNILAAMSNSPRSLDQGEVRKPAMSLMRWAHENNAPHDLARVGPRAFPYMRWLDLFLGQPALECPLEAVDEVAIANNLTYQEAMDLKWALGVLQSGKSK
jgi:hypothetical protein